MQDNLDTILQQRRKTMPRADLTDDIIRAAHADTPKTVTFFMFRPRYAYAVLGVIAFVAIALIASMPQGGSYSSPPDEPLGDISTYMVYDTLTEFDASV